MNRSKQKGTSWESAIRDYLRANGWPYAERLPLTGSRDRGDLAGIPGVTIEAKSAARTELGVWINEATIEQTNAGTRLGVVWAKRRGKVSPAYGYVIMTGEQFVGLLHDAGY